MASSTCLTDPEVLEEASEADSDDSSEAISLHIPGLKKYASFLRDMSIYLMNTFSRTIFASLLNDYVESEFFVIDGDSLLITCIKDKSLKKGQSLHFFFLVERFLLNLSNKGARYVVVFFEDMEYLYLGQPDLILLRTQLRLHLAKNLGTDVYIFTSFLSREWKEFLQQKCPYFLMVSDEGMSLLQTYFLNLLILDALGNKTNIVLTAGQENDHLRVYGYHVSSRFHHQRYVQKNLEKVTSTAEGLRHRAQICGRQASPSLFNQVKQEKLYAKVMKCISHLSNSLTKRLDIRIIITAVSCSLILPMCTENQDSLLQDKKSTLTLDEVADLCKMYCLTTAIVLRVPLSQRAKIRSLNADWNKHALLFINMKKLFENIVLTVAKDESKKSNWKIDWKKVSDLTDDLLMKNIAYYYEKEEGAGLQLEYGSDIDQIYKDIWSTTLQLVPEQKKLASFQIRTTSKHFLSDDSSVNVKREKIPTAGLIPIRSAIIEDFAGDIMKELPFLSSDDPVMTLLNKTKSYDELFHWHSGKPLGDDYDRTKQGFTELNQSKWAMKQYQKYQTFQRYYGQSLGVTMVKNIVVQRDELEKSHEGPKLGKKKEPWVKKKDAIIEENQRKAKAMEENKDTEKWRTMASGLQNEIKRDIFLGIKRQDQFIKSIATPSVKFCAEFTALNTCFQVWQEHCRLKSKDQRDINIAVEVMKKIHTIMNKHEALLQKQHRKMIAEYLNFLGFENLACFMQPPKAANHGDKMVTNDGDEKVTRLENKMITLPGDGKVTDPGDGKVSVPGDKNITSFGHKTINREYTVGVGSSRFQMQYMGPYLLRDERSDPDPRVEHFIPDTWQRELLDVVDNKESAVIVAPTSSGKTYASYYCMEKVLRKSDESVVVYVAPTKALVNQVVATVTNQFTKNLPDGMALCGVFTRDYRTDALNCQVLVTVPQCLEILLLSPHRQTWIKKIEYVIFDEVHCLGGEIGADVWEHILVMIRCPFLALSATISNPEHLTAWLQSVKTYWQKREEVMETSSLAQMPKRGGKKQALRTKKSYRVRLVLHEKRYNDLEKYVCSVKDSNINFEHHHPCAALTIDHIKKYGIPKDLTFSPRENIQLYDAMVKVWPSWPRAKELDPEENMHIKDKIIITKNESSKFEEELKTELINWTKNGHAEKTGDVLKHLQVAEPPPGMMCEELFPKLVEKLKEENKLPALFFAFNKILVERLSEDLLCSLTEISEAKQTVKVDIEIKKLETKSRKLKKSQQSSSKEDALILNRTSYEMLQKRLQKINEIPPGATYADETNIDKETLMTMFEKLRSTRNAEKLKYLAERGIGYHHGAMQEKERRFVEMLFRLGHMRVVTATGTLALGINMPCRSVVFLEDSIYLDALNYRQMSGRAGRRGQDLLGNVFFFGIPMPKVKKLLKSNVPQLKGQFPLSISLILRLMLLAARADDKEDAKAKALSILMHSLMTYKQPRETHLLKLFSLFSLHYLIHEGYLDQDCKPMLFTGLVTHLHYHEPSNYVFVSFLKKGLFRKLCQPCKKNPNKFPDSVMESLVLILANLFARNYFVPHFMSRHVKFHQSKVFLDPLPDDFSSAVKEHNKNVATIFGHCLFTAAKLADMEKECQLPFSEISFSGKECTDSQLVNHVMDCDEERSGISPFACLSGNSDHNLFAMENVNSLMLQTAQIPDKHIPILPLQKKDPSGRKLMLNAFALDFFKHRSLQAIVNENGFNEGDAYNKLKDFSLTISAISVSVKEMCEDENDPVVLAFEQLNTMYKEMMAF
ncbi:probable ATP-dependent RNA helicase DDX60 [Spea bombifrons]|uniref:probable ATP-dependent RNA helicase DDX60 n=1 Tax=Spea bombifrons TaxID=233779 RepID=UPI00234A6C72|nr:probable ATP-dependent RNA helicase DDX60 [Spea bombifrons]